MEARAQVRSKEQGAGEEGGRGGKWEQGGGSVGCRPGKGAVGEVGYEADAQAPHVSGRREERRGQPDGPRPKRKKGGGARDRLGQQAEREGNKISLSFFSN